MKNAHIVLVEDNPGDVVLVKLALQECGISHSLTEFETGRDAVRVLCDETHDAIVPDAILMDLNTPCTDGFDALHKLRDCPRLSRVPIAILTSSRAQSDKHRASILGARYIEKPSQLKEFLSSVGNAVREMLHAQGVDRTTSTT